MYCRYCNKKGLSSCEKGSFIDSGFDNWKKALERFKHHAESDLHKEVILRRKCSVKEEYMFLLQSR